MTDRPAEDWAAPEAGSGAAMPWHERPRDMAGGAPAAGLTAPAPPVPLRPLTLADILDGAFSAIRSSPRKVMAIAATFVVPAELFLAFAQRNIAVPISDVFDSQAADSTFSTTTEDDVAGVYGAVFGSFLLSSLVLLFIAAALARLVAAWYAGRDISARDAITGALRRSPALVGAWLLVKGIEIVVAVPTCGIGLAFVLPMFWVVTPAIALEAIGPIAGLRRSWRLARRRYWPTVGAVLLTAVVWYALQTALPLLPELLGAVAGERFGWILSGAGGSFAAMITTPVLAASSVLVYLDLRMRTEGLDLELDANRLL